MAEGFAKSHLKEYLVSSGGTHPEKVNPYAIKVMRNIGIDISNHISKKINKDQFESFSLVITLCGDAKDKCPVLDKSVMHIHWGLEDPAKFKGSDSEIMSDFGKTRDLILNHMKELKLNLEKGVL